MKFCLSSRQTSEYLAQADEIRILFRDVEQIFDLLDTYPEKTFIYNLEDFTFRETLQELAKLSQGRITLALYNLNDIDFAKEYNYPYYYIRPCKTLDEIKALKALGVTQILIDEPLTHMLHKVKLICGNLKVRAIPVYSYLDSIPRDNGVAGNWFRPEDVEAYSIYIDIIEFGSQPQRREQALFRIYAKEHEWPGDLGRLIPDLNYIGINRMLNPEFTMKRMNCGMICAEGKCSICYNLLELATEEKMRELGPRILETSQKNNTESET